MLTKREAIKQLNAWGRAGTAFSFYCDFLGEKWCVRSEAGGMQSDFDLSIGASQKSPIGEKSILKKRPIDFSEFKKSFDQVVAEINLGNSFLTNLTFQTPIETNLSLVQIFQLSHAKYKLHVPDQMVVFSPETFVKIKGHTIYSHPMKGTIDAKEPHARSQILNDPKERAEHITIVDLIRNDLSRVADEVTVPSFRYVEKIETAQRELLQVSSEVTGQLPSDWRHSIGHILSQMLPAGSISGAPKRETLRIIQQTERYARGFYTGICGHFDGENLDSGVMIRFIKKENGQLYFCSGGGITSQSEAEKEYQEMLDKVYLPI